MDEKALDQIELLLSQSLRGHHHLFHTMEIAKVLSTPTEQLDFFCMENMGKIQELFTELIAQESFEEKQRFIAGLTPENYEILLRTYFHIVDNSAAASTPLKH